MGSLGTSEMILIFVLALLIFGPKKLPELGRNLAKAMGEFRRASNELKSTWDREMQSIDKETSELKSAATDFHNEVTNQYDESYYNYGYDSPETDYSYSSSTSNPSTTSTQAVESAANGTSAPEAAGTETAKAGLPTLKTPEGTIAQSGVDAAPSVDPASQKAS
jgi:sec-independent protein translocase protein TatA